MQILRVRNWAKFQHYRDRNPPWIKLHLEILSSRDWVMLNNDGRLLAITCMLIASRDEGYIPYDPDYISRVSYMKNVDLKPLIDCGFLEVASNRKQMLADARPEKEAEKEAEKEKEHKKQFLKNGKANGHGREKPTSGSEAIERIIGKWDMESGG